MAYMEDESPHILPAILGQATRVMAMAISELTGYFYGVLLVLITGISGLNCRNHMENGDGTQQKL